MADDRAAVVPTKRRRLTFLEPMYYPPLRRPSRSATLMHALDASDGSQLEPCWMLCTRSEASKPFSDGPPAIASFDSGPKRPDAPAASAARRTSIVHEEPVKSISKGSAPSLCGPC